MTAYLDRLQTYGEHSGGVSDPRLVRRLDAIPQATPEQIETVRRLIRRHFPTDSPADQTARAELEAMILP